MTLLAVGAGLVGVGFVLSWALGWVVRWVAPRVGLVDRPGGHKGHRRPTPLGGGVAIWATTVLVLAGGAAVLRLGGEGLPEGLAEHAAGLWERAGELAAILGLATVLMLMGLADDRKALGWRPRLAVQVGLAVAVVVGVGARATLFWPLAHPVVSGAITVLWIVGLTNSFNFLDNMDGLAAGVGLIAAGLFAAAQAAVGGLFVPAVLLVMVGALGGFLAHNAPPARLFMGDAGSNFLGFMLGTLTVVGTFARPYVADRPTPRFAVLAPLLVMAVPLYDTVTVVLIRLRAGRSPFQPDRSHFSHRLVERGLSRPRAVLAIYLVTLAGGLGALLLHLPGLGPAGAAVVVSQTVCLLGLVAVLELSTNRPERRDGEATTAAPLPEAPRPGSDRG